MTLTRTVTTLFFSAVLVAPLATWAADPSPAPTAQAAPITVVGTNLCLGCALKKERGAGAQCSKYGHRHSLRVEKASDSSGKELAALKGRTLGYLDNDKADQLAKGNAFHKERVQVTARLYEPESTLEVLDFKKP